MPPSRYFFAWKVPRKNPRASRKTSGSTRITPGSWVSMNFISLLESVAVPAHGQEMAGILRVLLELDPQRADEVVHRPRRALVLRSPAARKQVVAGEGAPARGEEDAQHLELLRADVHRLLGPLHRLAVEVHLDVAEAGDRCLLRGRRPAAQQRLDPGQ